MLNKCMIIGHLGGDPEMRYTANGNAVTTFRVATSHSFTGPDKERKTETEWFSVVTWNRLAETCAQYLIKGREVYVEGRMQTRSWDAQDGQKRYRTELIAEQVRFLGGRAEQTTANDTDFGTLPADADLDELPF